MWSDSSSPCCLLSLFHYSKLFFVDLTLRAKNLAELYITKRNCARAQRDRSHTNEIRILLGIYIRARRNFVRGEARSTRGGVGRGVAAWGFREAEPPGRRRCFQTIYKKRKIYNFLKNFQEIFSIFSKIL